MLFQSGLLGSRDGFVGLIDNIFDEVRVLLAIGLDGGVVPCRLDVRVYSEDVEDTGVPSIEFPSESSTCVDVVFSVAVSLDTNSVLADSK